MFLLSVTRRPIPDVSGLERHEVPLGAGNFMLTLAVDGRFSRVERDSLGGRLALSPLLPGSSTAGTEFFSAQWSEATAEVEIDFPLLSTVPVHWHINEQGEFFCSPGIRLLQQAGVKLETDEDRLPELLTTRRVAGPRTLFKGIQRLAKASQSKVRVGPAGCELFEEPQYHVQSFGTGLGAQLRTVDDAAQIAIGYIDEALAPLAPVSHETTALLSGGMDSSALWVHAQRLLGLQESYSSGYPWETTETNEELRYAQTAAEALGSSHQYVEPTRRDYLRGLITTIAAVEEPLIHLQCVLLHLLWTRFIPTEKRITLIANSAEALGGLRAERRTHLIRKYRPLFRTLSIGPARKLLELASERSRHGAFALNLLEQGVAENRAYQDPTNPIWGLSVSGDEEWVYAHFGGSRRSVFEWRMGFIEPYEDRSYLEVSHAADRGSVSLTDWQWGKIAMDAGRISYDPYRLESYFMLGDVLPIEMRVSGPKPVMTAMHRQLGMPSFLSERPKISFGLGQEHWATRDGAFAPLVHLASSVVDESWLRELQSTDSSRAYTYWMLLNYAIWTRLMIDDEPVESLLDELDDALGHAGG